MNKEFKETKRKTPLEMFKVIKDLEVADSPLMTVEDCLPFMCEKVEQALLKAQKDEKLKVDICEMFGLDNLFPYNDTDAILKELEEYMDRHNELWVDFMKTSKELKAIKEAEPSEALESLKPLDIQVRFLGILDIPSWEKYLPTIKQALLKAEKLEKAWEVVKEKNVDIEKLKYQLRIKDDDVYLHYKYDLRMTREEFDLLKEMLK